MMSVQRRPTPRRIGYEDDSALDREVAPRPCVGGKVTSADANVPSVDEMLDQPAFACAGLEKAAARLEVRQQRRDRFGRRAVGVLRDAREGRALAHHDTISRTNACLKARSARDILDSGRVELSLQDISILPSGGSVSCRSLTRRPCQPAGLTSQKGMECRRFPARRRLSTAARNGGGFRI